MIVSGIASSSSAVQQILVESVDEVLPQDAAYATNLFHSACNHVAVSVAWTWDPVGTLFGLDFCPLHPPASLLIAAQCVAECVD